ncbi:MAG TPA: hypothetical protein VIX86_16600 [Streptosporangiaceae bacterium]
MTAVVLGVLTLALTVLYVPLAWPARDVGDGWQVLLGFLAFALPGVVVARRQPGNPIGWILIGLGVYAGAITDVGRYAVLDYHFHHGGLLFGPAAVVVATGLWTGEFLVLPLVILLFPDGRLPRRWRLVLWAYLADAGLVAAYILGAAAWAMSGQPVAVDGAGQLVKQPNPPVVFAVAVALIAALPVFWVLFVVQQVLSWRQATGERRQQLKWLMSGAAITVLGLAGVFGFASSSSPAGFTLEIVSFFASFALPVAICVGILKYRLYEIDRIVSRTLAYAIVTGLLVGVYAGLVLLATRVLSFHTPVAVAASTLAAAALFHPLRRRVQRAVDRRFNRARYNADKTIAAFAARLTGAVDLDSVRDDLAGVVHQALEPECVSVWIRAASRPGQAESKV